MSVEDTPTADDIRQTRLELAAGGVSRFSDGTNSVDTFSLDSLKKVEDEVRVEEARSTPLASVFKNTVQLRSPGGGFR